MTMLHATRGANYWSRHPVTRMDLLVGAYEDISSADVDGFTDALVSAMPGLETHRCSIGERGGFIVRLNDGTYAAHIVEHVALELQTMIGHDVGYGRTREGDIPAEYTVVFEHMHESVGLRAGALALETVQQAFAHKLQSVDHAVSELAALAATPDVPPLVQNVLCGITGGSDRSVARDEIVRRGVGSDELLIDVSPAYLLQAGLPYAHSEIGIILDANLADVPVRYREPERAQRLVSTLADAVDSGGIMIVPAKEWEIQDRIRDAGARVAIFSDKDDITRRDRKVARASAFPRNGRIMVETRRKLTDVGVLQAHVSPGPQVAAALAMFTLEELQPASAAPAAAVSS
jgi:cyanophycin synthase-like protein